MLGKKIKTTLLSVIVALTAITAYTFIHFKIPPASAQETPWVTMYIDPPTITGLKPGDTFSITLKIKNFTDLYGWQVGIQWDPSKLECTGVLYGQSVWPESIFKVLAPTRTALPQDGTIDNAAGKIYPPYSEGLTGAGGVTGTGPTIGYNMMNVTFMVETYAPSGTEISFIISDPYGPVSCWAAWPNVSELLVPSFENATIYTIAPPTPESPVASFTWTPTNPVTSQTVIFDASSSLQGFDGTASCPITEYRWDFETDGTWDIIGDPDTAKIVYHAFDAPGDYNVTLEVYAPGNYPPGIPDTDNITKTITVSVPPPPPTAPTLVYLDKPVINATTIGQTIEVKVKIKDFMQLYGWYAAVKWNNTILNCTNVVFGPQLTTSVFKVLAPTRTTSAYGGGINNTEGYIYPAVEMLSPPGEGVTGEAGVSYDLMKLTFKVMGIGVTDLHLYEVNTFYYPLVNGNPQEGQTLLIDTYTLRTDQGDLTIKILTNSTGLYSDIYGHAFSIPNKEFRFIILVRSYRTYADTTKGFVNVTIPKTLMWVTNLNEWSVSVNGATKIVTASQNATHYFLYFTYPHRTDGDPTEPYPHEIIIRSTYVIPEYPNPTLAILLVSMAFAALLIRKYQSKKPKIAS